ncbi:hypothetical protein [Syntrophomonas erecta]
MLKNKNWQFCEMVALNRQSDGRINFPYRYLKYATEAEVEEYKSLEIESKPLVEVCELFTPVELNFKWLTDITDNKSIDDYKGISYGELEDRVAVQAANYIFAFQVLIEHWKSFVGHYLRSEKIQGNKVKDYYNYLKGSMSTRSLIKALRNYLTHHARIPLRCGNGTDIDTGKIDFVIWVSKNELLSNSHFHADDRAAIEAMSDFFNLIPILKTSRQEIERFQLLMHEVALLSKKALTLRDKARDMQKRFGLEGHDFFLLKSSEIFPDKSKTHEFYRPTFNLEYVQLRWGLVLLIDAFDTRSKMAAEQEK